MALFVANVYRPYFFAITGDKGDDALGTFADSLLNFTRYSEFRPLATLSYASDIYNGSSIVSRFAQLQSLNSLL